MSNRNTEHVAHEWKNMSSLIDLNKCLTHIKLPISPDTSAPFSQHKCHMPTRREDPDPSKAKSIRIYVNKKDHRRWIQKSSRHLKYLLYILKLVTGSRIIKQVLTTPFALYSSYLLSTHTWKIVTLQNFLFRMSLWKKSV